jgi:hypothetical protein
MHGRTYELQQMTNITLGSPQPECNISANTVAWRMRITAGAPGGKRGGRGRLRLVLTLSRSQYLRKLFAWTMVAIDLRHVKSSYLINRALTIFNTINVTARAPELLYE